MSREGYDVKVIERERAAASALASVRAEGLEPGRAIEELLEAWSNGEITDAQLEDAKLRLARGEHLSRPFAQAV